MIKILGSLLVIASSVFLGYQVRRFYHMQITLLRGLICLIDETKADLRSHRSTVFSHYHRISTLSDIQPLGFLPDCIERMKLGTSHEEAYQASFSQWEEGNKYLDNDKKALFLVFPRIYGAMDEESQMEGLQSLENQVEKVLHEAQSKEKEKGKLFLSLGLFGGLCIVILWL